MRYLILILLLCFVNIALGSYYVDCTFDCTGNPCCSETVVSDNTCYYGYNSFQSTCYFVGYNDSQPVCECQCYYSNAQQMLTCNDVCSVNLLKVDGVAECTSNGASCSYSEYYCNSSPHTNCQSVDCGVSTFYCTYDGSTWEWRTSKPSEVDKACNDGVDNDCDGYVDSEDCDCRPTCDSTNCGKSYTCEGVTYHCVYDTTNGWHWSTTTPNNFCCDDDDCSSVTCEGNFVAYCKSDTHTCVCYLQCETNDQCAPNHCCKYLVTRKDADKICVEAGTIIDKDESYDGKPYICDPPVGFESNDKLNFLDLLFFNPFSFFG